MTSWIKFLVVALLFTVVGAFFSEGVLEFVGVEKTGLAKELQSDAVTQLKIVHHVCDNKTVLGKLRYNDQLCQVARNSAIQNGIQLADADSKTESGKNVLAGTLKGVSQSLGKLKTLVPENQSSSSSM